MQKNKENDKLTKEDALKVLKKEQEKDRQAFLQEFESLSKKHGLTFASQAYITNDGRIAVRIVIVPREKTEEGSDGKSKNE